LFQTPGRTVALSTKIAQRAGIEHAKKTGKFLGRKPQFTRAQVDLILEMLAKGTSITEIARAVGCERQTVYKIRDDTAAAIAALARWDDAGEKPASRPGHGSEGRRKATSRGMKLDAWL
jgi:DNA invertase Pin-like site-specific DNA recombinase